MYKVLLVALCAVCCASCSKKAEFVGPPTNEITFSSLQSTPRDFNSWVFFWQMPEVDRDAQMAYTVSVGKKDYFEYVFTDKPSPGSNIRSDFNDKLLKGQMDNLKGKIVKITLKVNKGTIEFPKKPNFRFVFWKSVDAVQKSVN